MEILFGKRFIFSKAKDLTQHFHMVHEANLEPEILEDAQILAANPNLSSGQAVYPCQWRGCSVIFTL